MKLKSWKIIICLSPLLLVLMVVVRFSLSRFSHDGIAEQKFILEAQRLAEHAKAQGQFPVGAVVVRGGEIIGRGFGGNRGQGYTQHAETKAMGAALQTLPKGKFVGDETLVTTYEPCNMCRGMAQYYGIKKIIYTTKRPLGTILGEYVEFFFLALNQQYHAPH